MFILEAFISFVLQFQPQPPTAEAIVAITTKYERMFVSVVRWVHQIYSPVAWRGRSINEHEANRIA